MSAKPPETPGADIYRVYRTHNDKEFRPWRELTAQEQRGWDAVAAHIACQISILAPRKEEPYHPRHD